MLGIDVSEIVQLLCVILLEPKMFSMCYMLGMCWSVEVRAVVDSILVSDPFLFKEVWIRMWGCYKDVVDRPPPPQPG